MRVRRLTTWLVLGMAVALAYAARQRRGPPQRRAVPAVPPAPGARGMPAEDASPDGVLGEASRAEAYGDRRASLGGGDL
jgi:hypothetical protein